MIFIKQILAGTKNFLVTADAPLLFVPHLPEFTLDNLLVMFANDAQFLSYLPDPNTQSKRINREFVYRMATSVRREYMSLVIDHA